LPAELDRLRAELERLEAELHTVERLALIGRLAAGLAHEINNPLAVMQGRIELLEQMDLTDARRVKKQLSVIHEHGLRIARIVGNLQTFAMPRGSEKDRVELYDILDQALSIADSALGEVRVQSHVAKTGLQVLGYRGQLEQALVNLLNHAVDSMRGTGTIVLRAHTDEHWVRIVLEYEGTAISPEVLASLAAVGSGDQRLLRGTRLGVAIAWGIVTEHGGDIAARQLDLGGATIEVRLPHAGPQGDEVVVQSSDTPIDALRVLVIEDERALLDTILEMAAASGYTAVGVTSAEAALTRVEGERFDLVLSDIRLPGMSGVDLVGAIAKIQPELSGRVVLMSGLFHQAPPGLPYLQKPFSRRQLVEQVEAIAVQSDA
jgi:two-component system NtrC family sensor kinase